MIPLERNPVETPRFTVGRDANGFWAAKSADGREGGLFVNREQAMKFARQPRPCGIGEVATPRARIKLWK